MVAGGRAPGLRRGAPTMPRYEIDGHEVTLISGPHFTTAELRAAVEAAIADRAFEAPMTLILDVRESRESASRDEIATRIALFARRKAYFRPRIAIIVSRMLHYGLARMASMMGDGQGVTIGVFYDLDEARRWQSQA